MTAAPASLRQLAKEGNAAAISKLISAQLKGRNLAVIAEKDNANCLTIRLRGKTVPDQAVYQVYIINGLQLLRPLDILSVRIIGEALEAEASAEAPWEARARIEKPRRSLRHSLQSPNPSASPVRVVRSGAGKPINAKRSRSSGQSPPHPSQGQPSRSSRTNPRGASNGGSYASLVSTVHKTVSQLIPEPSGPPGVWSPLWLEWCVVTGSLTLFYGLLLQWLLPHVMQQSSGLTLPLLLLVYVPMVALVVYLQTCVVSRRVPNAGSWLAVSLVTSLLTVVVLPLPSPIPGVGPIQGIGQSWTFRRTAKEPLSWAVFHVLLIVTGVLVPIQIDSHPWPFTLTGYILISTGLVARCLGSLPEQLPAPPMGLVAYGQAFLRRPLRSAERASATSPTITGSTTHTISSLRAMVSETLGELFIEQNLWAIWLFASAAMTGLSFWLFISFIDHFAALNLFVWFVIFAQLGLIVIPFALYVLIVLVSNPPRSTAWQIPGLLLLGIASLQLWIISGVILRGSG